MSRITRGEPSRQRRCRSYFATAVTSAVVTGDALFPHELRMYDTTPAICASESCEPHGGITPLNESGPTMTFPVRPYFTIWMTFFGSPVTTGFPANGGKEPAKPLPPA